MKKSITYVILTIMLFLISTITYGQVVNTTTQIVWAFDLGTAGQVATYTAGTKDYFAQDYVSVGSNLAIKDFKTIDNTYTRFQPAIQSGIPGDIDAIGFNIKPKSGLTFKPTSVSFDCMRWGTDGGFIDVVWKTKDGITTTLQTAIKPARDNTAAGTKTTIDVSALNVAASSGESSLQIYLYALGNTKQAGIAD
ncbi:hypothetical protein JZU68_04760, partial [bacterium]|nr:hypothetical protein [bacterium]